MTHLALLASFVAVVIGFGCVIIAGSMGLSYYAKVLAFLLGYALVLWLFLSTTERRFRND